MTKIELIKALENIDDNAEILFVSERYDRDGFPEDMEVNVYKVLDKRTATWVGKDCGIHRYE